MPNDLVFIKEQVIPHLKNILPTFNGGKNKTATSLMNAWTESICLDSVSGGIYVKADRLHTILRLASKADGQYFVESIPSKDKIERNNEVYVATYAVISKLNERMIKADMKKRGYLQYSEQILQTIRDAPEIRLEQEKIRQLEESLLKTLKTQRIQLLKIKRDELTNAPLVRKTAEFSHIRKKSEYHSYATNIYNGLIVNKETHEIITKKDIYDEEQLLDLCLTQKWNVDWYDKFIKYFR